MTKRKAKAKPAKKRAAKKPAKVAKPKGGKREGAGRPAAKLPQDVIDRLGPPPEGSRELRAWNAKLLAEVQWLSINGKIGTDLAASLRANAGSIDRALPADAPTSNEDDDLDEDDEDGGDGPELEDNAEEDAGPDGLRMD